MGKLKQHLPTGVSPDNDLFLAMFLVRLPPSMHETVGASNHMTARSQKKSAKARRRKSTKKAKGSSAKEKALIRTFSSSHSGKPVSEPKAAWRGGKQGS
jgi:hypothetical protein